MKNKYFFLAMITGAIVCMLAIGTIIYMVGRPHPAIPQTIQKQLDFKPFYLSPSASDVASIDPKSVKYDSQEKLLSYFAKLKNPASILTVSQQATPINFTEIPDLYDHLVADLHQYSSITTRVGTVYLTRPTKNNSGNNQTAVMNNQGVLIFVKSSRDLTDDQWKQLFNELTQ